MCVERQTKIPPRSKRIVIVVIDARCLVQIVPLLEWKSTQAPTTASGFLDAIPNRPFNLVILSRKNVPAALSKYQQIAKALSPPRQHSYRIDVMSLPLIYRARQYLRLSTSLNISPRSTGFRRWQTMNWSLKKTKECSQSAVERISPSRKV